MIIYVILHKTIFILCFIIILLGYFKASLIIAEPSRLFYNPSDNKFTNNNNEGLRHIDKDTMKSEFNGLYEYDNFLAEYYFGDEILKSNVTGSQEKKILPYLKYILKNKTSERPKPSKCFLNDIRIQRQLNKLRLQRLSEILKIWFLVYLALAIPLWCTKGWCCCCLLCNFFKPNKMIEEAKIFLETNPPGVFRHRGGVIYYEPSDNERDCYEKLEHLIRTI